jgi:N-methylhydantoinase B
MSARAVPAEQIQLDAFEPGALEAAWLRLCCIADEGAAALRRAARSVVVRECNDYAVVVADADGAVIAENALGPPLFLGVLGDTLRGMLRILPADAWQQGDRVVTNDPWLSAGHTHDLAMASAIERDGRRIGYAVTIAHLPDIGGGSFGADSRSLYEEGLLIPPRRWQRDGVENDELVALIAANVRVPGQVLGDIRAQSAAHAVIARAVIDLLDDIGADSLSGISAALQARAERSMRNAIAGLPDGTWRTAMTADGAAGQPTRIACAITKHGDRLTVDYDGSSPQSPIAINAVLSHTRAMTQYALKCVLDPTAPRNEGTYRAIEVLAPEGSILNALRPAPTSARQLTGQLLPGVVFACMAQVRPERVAAESGSAPTLRANFSGIGHDGEPFAQLLLGAGGLGATAKGDGEPCLTFPGNAGYGSTEACEVAAPLVIRRRTLVPDSGGAGMFRGGLGQEVEVEVTATRPVALSMMADRVTHPPSGILGGLPGLGTRVQRVDGTPIDPKGRTVLPPGARLLLRFAGGGGYGPPEQRDPAATNHDLREGWTTASEQT